MNKQEREYEVIDYDQIMREESPFADRLAQWISFRLQPKQALDFGCGPGCYTYAMHKYGIHCLGVDMDERVKNKPYLVCEDIRNPSMDHFKVDLVLCLEVFEHIPAKETHSIMASMLTKLKTGGFLIFSAAHPGQGGDGHINCRHKQEWIAMLAEHGMTYNDCMHEDLYQYIKSGYYMGWFLINMVTMVKSVDKEK
jgi:2-polyprenyl-3-methyl-5-hydroxy-6-metoxy-1,4-benzoquinol methylase